MYIIERSLDLKKKCMYDHVRIRPRGGFKPLSENDITEAADTYWNISSQQFNRGHVYLPSLRLSGNFYDVAAYVNVHLRRCDVPVETIAAIMSCTITYENHLRADIVRFYFPVARSRGAVTTFSWQSEDTTTNAIYVDHVQKVKIRRKSRALISFKWIKPRSQIYAISSNI